MSKVSWAILIPTLTERKPLLERLLKVLYKQIDAQSKHQIEVLVYPDSKQKTTGYKRNKLMEEARTIGAKYISFFDDDDLPGSTYIQRNLEGIELDVDCNSLLGQIYFAGKPGNPFHHSIKYDHWYQDSKMYYRNPNHISCIKLSCLEGIQFRDQVIGEDGHFSIDIQKAGVLKTEYNTKDIIYHYLTGKKDPKQEAALFNQLMNS